MTNLLHVELTTYPPQILFGAFGLRRKGFAILDQEVRVGPGRAARSRVLQVEGNLLNSGYFGADNIIIVTPLLWPLELVHIFSGSELVRRQT